MSQKRPRSRPGAEEIAKLFDAAAAKGPSFFKYDEATVRQVQGHAKLAFGWHRSIETILRVRRAFALRQVGNSQRSGDRLDNMESSLETTRNIENTICGSDDVPFHERFPRDLAGEQTEKRKPAG